MRKVSDTAYSDERSLFASDSLVVENCTFKDGESPLKESQNIEIDRSTFCYKYPIWYSHNVKIKDSKFEEMARSGIWYIDGIEMVNCEIIAPKTFRKGRHITIVTSQFPNAKETLWGCKDIKIESCYFNGDYFAYNSEYIVVENTTIDGNYAFDSCKNVTVKNCVLNSKDAFWNCENVRIENCTIIGEYLAWNTKNIRLINCRIESHQGLCYIENLVMQNCTLEKSDLTFEYCKNVNATIISVVDSIKNPISGIIMVRGVRKLILDDRYIDPHKTAILIQ